MICCLSSQSEVTSPTDSEDRTPGRLQAIWPPPKPKDEEEKVGLRYTEAGKDLRHPGALHLLYTASKVSYNVLLEMHVCCCLP